MTPVTDAGTEIGSRYVLSPESLIARAALAVVEEPT